MTLKKTCPDPALNFEPVHSSSPLMGGAHQAVDQEYKEGARNLPSLLRICGPLSIRLL